MGMRLAIGGLFACLISFVAHAQCGAGSPLAPLDECDQAVIARASPTRPPADDPAFAELVYNVRAWAGTPNASPLRLTADTLDHVIDRIPDNPGQLVRATVQIIRIEGVAPPAGTGDLSISDLSRWTVRLLPAARSSEINSSKRLTLEHPPLDPRDIVLHVYMVDHHQSRRPGDLYHLVSRVYRAPGPAYQPEYFQSPTNPQTNPPGKVRLELVGHAPAPSLNQVIEQRQVASAAEQVAAALADPDGESKLKIVTFNIRYGTADDGPNAWPHRRDMVTDLLRDMDADVIGLQESLRFQLDEIGAALPGYVEIGIGRGDGIAAGEYSPLFVRSERFAVAAAGTFWLSETPETPGSTSWGNRIPRICTWARLIEKSGGEDGPRTVWAYNVHMDHLSAPSRQRGAELIAAHMRDRAAAFAGEPVVLMGDFNAGEASAPLKYLCGQAERASDVEMWPEHEPAQSPELVDTFRAVHPEAEEVGTFSAFRVGATHGEKIDHVLVSEKMDVLDAGIDGTMRDGRYPSDHFAVWAVLKF